jgi:restriction system protein
MDVIMARSRKATKPSIVEVLLPFAALIAFFLSSSVGQKLAPKSGSMTQMAIGFIPPFVVMAVPILLLAYALRLRREKYIRALQIADVDNMSGRDYEKCIARLLEHRGFHVQLVGRSGDLGVDMVAQKEGIKYAIQTKRWKNGVDRTAVSDAVAGMCHYKSDRAIVITNCYFRTGAKQLAKSNQCVLVDRETLSKWILEFHTPERK